MSEAYETYEINIKRVKNFINLYRIATQNQGRGRKNTQTTDILRAGIVFLHSTLEEYLRTIILSKKMDSMQLDSSSFHGVLSNVNLMGDNTGKSTGKKYALADFWAVKDKKVIDVVTESLKEKIGYMTFNDYSQVIGSLKEVNIVLSYNFNAEGLIDNYIKRRHKIVHEADKNAVQGRGYYQSASINTKTLAAWIDAVDELVKEIELQL